MLAVTALTFAIFYLLPPGDPALRFVGKQPTPQSIALVRHNLGLDKPWYVEYGKFVKAIVVGDKFGWPGLGYSYDSSTSDPRPDHREGPENALTDPRRLDSLAHRRRSDRRDLGDQTQNGRRPNRDRIRALRHLRAGLLARADGAVHLLVQARHLTGDRVRLLHAESRAMGLASDTAVGRARAPVRGDLRPDGARQPARRDGRGLHPHSAREGAVRADASSSSTGCARAWRRS